MNCKSKAVLLCAISVLLVCGLIVSASAGELIDDAPASIEQSPPELSMFEEVLSLPVFEDTHGKALKILSSQDTTLRCGGTGMKGKANILIRTERSL